MSKIAEKAKQTYLNLQNTWAKELNVSKGSLVKISGKAADHQGGWDCVWVRAMDEAVGRIGTVLSVGKKGAHIKGTPEEAWSGCLFPYFVLEPVEQSIKIRDVLVAKLSDGTFTFNGGELTEDELTTLRTFLAGV